MIRSDPLSCVATHAFVEVLAGQTNCLCERPDSGLRKPFLSRKKAIVHFPKLTVSPGAFGCFTRPLGQGMNG